MNSEIKKYIQKVVIDLGKIPQKRKKILLEIVSYIKQNYLIEDRSNIIFICTHNSRRSQLAQCWLSVSCRYYNLNKINTFSGGLEITSLNSNALNALKRSGFIVNHIDTKDNIYLLKTSKKNKGQTLYSKKHDSKNNPQRKFLAIITCSDANKQCPVVRGADKKIFLPYHDPRISDGSGLEKTTYDQSCFNIAQEMFYIMKKVKEVI